MARKLRAGKKDDLTKIALAEDRLARALVELKVARAYLRQIPTPRTMLKVELAMNATHSAVKSCGGALRHASRCVRRES